jgi:hypothetical protein
MDDVLVIDNLDEHELQVLQEITEQMVECVMDNRHFGYWHIGQVYNKMAKFAATRVPTDDMQLTRPAAAGELCTCLARQDDRRGAERNGYTL